MGKQTQILNDKIKTITKKICAASRLLFPLKKTGLIFFWDSVRLKAGGAGDGNQPWHERKKEGKKQQHALDV